MQKNSFLFVLVSALMLGLSSCAEPPKPAPAPSDGPGPEVVATIKDIMNNMVDPAADDLWDSVKVVIDAKGTTEYYPRTDEEWKKVRGYALALVEAPNLLVMNRKIAKTGEKSETPCIEEEPEAIQALIDADRATFAKLALGLQTTALAALKAIDAKDKDELSNVGGAIDGACEQCHKKYWYPNEAKCNEAQAAGKKSQGDPGSSEEKK